jgi:hypothetical protein
LITGFDIIIKENNSMELHRIEAKMEKMENTREMLTEGKRWELITQRHQ